MDINHSAPATATGEVQIDADPHTAFAVLSALEQWPSWNPDVKSVEVKGRVEPGTVFCWKSGASTLTSKLEVVDPPREIGWTGTTMGIRAIHVFHFVPSANGTVVRSEESWDGILANIFPGFSSRTIDKTINNVLAHLKTEAERQATTR
jgi:uncharacterized protein YndB with AHSA1/START domain